MLSRPDSTTKGEPIEIDPAQRKILDWRVEQLLKAGFEELHAAAIAVNDDWRLAITAVKGGLDHRSAMDLIL